MVMIIHVIVYRLQELTYLARMAPIELEALAYLLLLELCKDPTLF